MDNYSNRAREGVKVLGTGFASLILGSLGFVTALTWNSTIQMFIETRFPEPKDKSKKLIYSFSLASFLTVFVIVSMFMSRYVFGAKLSVPQASYYGFG